MYGIYLSPGLYFSIQYTLLVLDIHDILVITHRIHVYGIYANIKGVY